MERDCFYNELKYVRDYACKAAGLDSEIAGWKTAVDAMTKQLADAQATVEALQRELLEWKRALCNLTPGGSEFADDHAYCAGWVRKVRENQHDIIISKHRELKATQAALDAEREKVAFVEKTAADFQVLWRAACDQREAFETQLSQLQALVRALPVVTGELEVDCGACYYVRALDGKENPVVCGLMTEQATAFAIKALLAYRASLDALTPATTKT